MAVTTLREDEILVRRRSSVVPKSTADSDTQSEDSQDDSRSSSDYECGSTTRRKSTGLINQSRRVDKLTRRLSSFSHGDPSKFNAEEYLDKRVMTDTQEWCNAITMLPGMLYAIHFILAGCWVQEDNIFQSNGRFNMAPGNEHDWVEGVGCISCYLFPYLTALPPLPVFAAALGMVGHSPFSMFYHWKCATTIKPSMRIKHWSRRVDHSFIHFASACASYATTGSKTYFLLNAIFNLDSAFRQFEEKICPRRNVTRIGLSIILYILPVLLNGHYFLVFQFGILFGLGGWLFVGYPLGGWSHAMFHLCLAFLPHLVISAAMQLESSQTQIELALHCADSVAG